MDPLVSLLLELGARAKSGEARIAALEGVIADQNKKIEDFKAQVEALAPTPEAPKEA